MTGHWASSQYPVPCNRGRGRARSYGYQHPGHRRSQIGIPQPASRHHLAPEVRLAQITHFCVPGMMIAEAAAAEQIGGTARSVQGQD
jgi:DsbC/DsbD-like thiol-disulfide interchange protein